MSRHLAAVGAMALVAAMVAGAFVVGRATAPSPSSASGPQVVACTGGSPVFEPSTIVVTEPGGYKDTVTHLVWSTWDRSTSLRSSPHAIGSGDGSLSEEGWVGLMNPITYHGSYVWGSIDTTSTGAAVVTLRGAVALPTWCAPEPGAVTQTPLHPAATSTGGPTTAPSAPVTSAPTLLAGVASCVGTTAVIKPESLIMGCGGSQPPYLTGISWSKWTNLGAEGSGTLYLRQCTPDCAAGQELSYSARVTLSQLRTRHGQLLFECFTVDAPGSAPTTSTLMTTCSPATGTPRGGWGYMNSSSG